MPKVYIWASSPYRMITDAILDLTVVDYETGFIMYMYIPNITLYD